jgi:hypothetical protein
MVIYRSGVRFMVCEYRNPFSGELYADGGAVLLERPDAPYEYWTQHMLRYWGT